MNQEKLPNNIKSIITALDEELINEFNEKVINKNDISDFINSIRELMKYYYNTLYKRVFTSSIDEASIDDFNQKLNLFIDILDKAINNVIDNYNKEELYEDIIEQITSFLIKTYWKLLITYGKTNNLNLYIIPNKTASPLMKQITNLITTPDELSLNFNLLNPFEITVLLNKTVKNDNIKLNNNQTLTLNNVPNVLLGNIRYLLYKLNKYNKFITIKQIIFIKDFNENNLGNLSLKEDGLISYINSTTNIKEIEYNLIYTLLKDQLLQVYDELYWRNSFAKILEKKYIADECIQFEQYLYSMQAELSYQEYFMSCVIAYILDPDNLKIFDYNQYRHIKRLLDGIVE